MEVLMSDSGEQFRPISYSVCDTCQCFQNTGTKTKFAFSTPHIDEILATLTVSIVTL
jgi:hypothetical protein